MYSALNKNSGRNFKEREVKLDPAINKKKYGKREKQVPIDKKMYNQKINEQVKIRCPLNKNTETNL